MSSSDEKRSARSGTTTEAASVFDDPAFKDAVGAALDHSVERMADTQPFISHRCKHRAEGHPLRCAWPSCPNGVSSHLYRVKVQDNGRTAHVFLKRHFDGEGFTWRPA